MAQSVRMYFKKLPREIPDLQSHPTLGEHFETSAPSPVRAYAVRFSFLYGISLSWGTRFFQIEWNLDWVAKIFDARFRFSYSWGFWGLGVQVAHYVYYNNEEWSWHVGPLFINYRWPSRLSSDNGSYCAKGVR